MKQTAVEWLLEQVPRIETIASFDILEQAKEMEKKQIIEAYRKGTVHGWEDEAYEYPNEYYTETYKSE